MTDTMVLDLALRCMLLGAKLSAPVLLVALIVGFSISLLQSVTQLQDVTLSFIPKLIAIGASLVIFGKWMLTQLTTFTAQLYDQIPTIVRGG